MTQKVQKENSPFWQQLQLKFQNLEEMKPADYVSQRMSLDVLNDDVVSNFNQDRYRFYIELYKIFHENAELFKRMISEKRSIENRMKVKEEIIDKIVKEYNKIFAITDKAALEHPEIYAQQLKMLKETDGKRLIEILGSQLDAYVDEKEKDTKQILEKIFGVQNGGRIRRGGGEGEPPQYRDSEISKLENEIQEAEKKIENVKLQEENKIYKLKQNLVTAKDNYEKNRVVSQYTDKLNLVLDSSDPNPVKTKKARDIINEINDDTSNGISSMKITKEDKLVFIGITFLIRLISLSLIDWSLNTNFVVTFKQAFKLYIFLYSIFILLFIVIVNTSQSIPIFEAYGNKSSVLSSISSISNTMYFFYLIPGQEFESGTRIMIHLGVMYFITLIALILNQYDNLDVPTKDNIRYDYTYKKHIRDKLNTFTLGTWVLLSFIAMA